MKNENLALTPDTLLGFACFKHAINIQENNNKRIGQSAVPVALSMLQKQLTQ